ncbi:MAG: transglycosylase SLT domain-containing protein [Nitratireductor sp.]
MRTVVAIVLLIALAGCGSTPRGINNVCTIFDQKDGWFGNWYRAAKKTEREYGVPASVLMATIRIESGFDSDARPPRKKLLGIIPWKRKSTAYGYSQALDGTWQSYKRETGRWGASRTDFADAIHFVGWYHYNSHRKNGIALNDAYSLYLAYYAGQAGYARGVWRGNAGMQKAARKAATMANSYADQMRQCGR